MGEEKRLSREKREWNGRRGTNFGCSRTVLMNVINRSKREISKVLVTTARITCTCMKSIDTLNTVKFRHCKF